MVRKLPLFLFVLFDWAILLFVVENLFAQGFLGNLDYSPPRVGLVGYSFHSNKQSTKIAPPTETIPSLPSSEHSNAETKGLFQVRQTASEGSVIQSTTPFLSEEEFAESPSINRSIGNESELIIPSDSSALVLSSPESSEWSVPPPTTGDGGFSSVSSDWNGEDNSGLSDFFLYPSIDHNGYFRSAFALMEYIPNVDSVKSGMTTFHAGARFALPAPDSDHLLVISPDFSWSDFTMPENLQPFTGEKVGLYSTGFNIDYLCPISDCFMVDANLGIGWNSDFKASSSDALRITGRGVGIWKISDVSRLVLGASYQNLSNWRILPIAGISWKPSEDYYFDLLFPSPKIARRITWMKGIKEIEEGESPYWLYLAGEYEGNRWIFKPNGPNQTSVKKEARMTYYDFRLFAGMEKRLAGEINWAIEGGMVFARHLEFEGIQSNDESPKVSALARMKLQF